MTRRKPRSLERDRSPDEAALRTGIAQAVLDDAARLLAAEYRIPEARARGLLRQAAATLERFGL